jgi:galactose mutarotase-like enzyme
MTLKNAFNVLDVGRCIYFSLKIAQTMQIKSIYTVAFLAKPYALAGFEPGAMFPAAPRHHGTLKKSSA